jgi:hypothetical protein
MNAQFPPSRQWLQLGAQMRRLSFNPPFNLIAAGETPSGYPEVRPLGEQTRPAKYGARPFAGRSSSAGAVRIHSTRGNDMQLAIDLLTVVFLVLFGAACIGAILLPFAMLAIAMIG